MLYARNSQHGREGGYKREKTRTPGHKVFAVKSLVAAHEDVEVDVGLRQDRHVRGLWHRARDGLDVGGKEWKGAPG